MNSKSDVGINRVSDIQSDSLPIPEDDSNKFGGVFLVKSKIQNGNYFRVMKCKLKFSELCLVPSKI